MSTLDPFVHSRSVALCAVCGAPDLPGTSCFCVDYTLDHEDNIFCEGCGAAPGDYVATCPMCRKTGRVDSAIVSFFDRVLTEPPFASGAPVLEQLAEEPLPTVRPLSWWPAAG